MKKCTYLTIYLPLSMSISLYIYIIYIYAHIHTYINQKQLYVFTQSFMLNAIIQPTKQDLQTVTGNLQYSGFY